MCIVSAEAKLTKTKILSMALDNGRHLLSYTNKAKNLSGKVNSMILPIPGKVDKDWFSNSLPDHTQLYMRLAHISTDATSNPVV